MSVWAGKVDEEQSIVTFLGRIMESRKAATSKAVTSTPDANVQAVLNLVPAKKDFFKV